MATLSTQASDRARDYERRRSWEWDGYRCSDSSSWDILQDLKLVQGRELLAVADATRVRHQAPRFEPPMWNVSYSYCCTDAGAICWDVFEQTRNATRRELLAVKEARRTSFSTVADMAASLNRANSIFAPSAWDAYAALVLQSDVELYYLADERHVSNRARPVLHAPDQPWRSHRLQADV